MYVMNSPCCRPPAVTTSPSSTPGSTSPTHSWTSSAGSGDKLIVRTEQLSPLHLLLSCLAVWADMVSWRPVWATWGSCRAPTVWWRPWSPSTSLSSLVNSSSSSWDSEQLTRLSHSMFGDSPEKAVLGGAGLGYLISTKRWVVNVMWRWKK